MVVVINDYVSDTEKEHNAIINFCKNLVFNKIFTLGKGWSGSCRTCYGSC